RERDVPPHREAVRRAPNPTYHVASEVHGLAAVDSHIVLAADDERAQAQLGRALELRPLSLRDAEAETGLERRVGARQVGAEVAVALLDPERVERRVADRLGRCSVERVPDLHRPGAPHVELEAEL